MLRKLLFLVCILRLLGGANRILLAGSAVWTNGGGDRDWCNQNNWNPDSSPPDSGDTAWVDQITYSCPNQGPIVFSGCAAQAGVLQGPNPAYGNTQVIDVNGTGTVNVGQWLWIDGRGTGVINIGDTANITIGGEQWRGPDNGVGILNISGDPQIFVSGTLKGSDGDDGFLYINMSGGRVECEDLVFGDNGGGELNLSDGSLILGDDLDLGGSRGVAPITVNMTGGFMRIGGELQLPGNANRAGVVVVNLHGGVIECGALVHGSVLDEGPSYTDEWLLDVEAGTLKIQGDVKAAIDANVAAGQITAYGGEGMVLVEVVDGNTVVTALPADPNTATNPYPPNRSIQVDPNVVCHWTPGLSAASHDVYFGTDFNDVNDGTTSEAVYQDNIEANEWDPCGVGVALDELTTYYWRIDEKNGSTWKGRVWHFTTSGPFIDPNMLLWYKFDEPNGFVATDSSGYGNDGMLNGFEELWDSEDGHAGGSRIFDGETVVQVPSGVLANIGSGITFCMWLKDTYEHSDNLVFDTGVGGETGPYHVYANVLSDEGDVVFRAGNDTNDLLRADVASREVWHHFAFVKDEEADEMCVYVDAELVNSKTGLKNTLVNIRGAAFKIGAPTWDNYDYEGKVDDFKVFDRALSEKDVAADYRGESVALAWAPSPRDYEQDVPPDANVSWRPGNHIQDTDCHKVFFGTTWDDANDMTEPCSVVDTNMYDPGLLELDTTYYWRIDEVNDPCVWRGPIWRFTVGDFLILDNFEQYTIGDPCQIHYTWYEQRSQEWPEATGSWLTLGTTPIYPVHTGEQCMIYQYDTADPWADVDYAEVWLPLEEISGHTDAEQMYVGVDDTDGAYTEVRYGDDEGEDMNDLLVEEWQSWDLPYTYFNDSNFAEVVNDVNFKSIANLYIGFGNKRNPVAAGKGVVYFDDIRLNLPICKPEYGPPADFSGNCIVDIADAGKMGQQWLRSDVNFLDDLGIQVQQPSEPNLVGHYKLDEGTGTFAEDSSANDYHGTLENTNEGGYSWGSGRIGKAVEFSGGRAYVQDNGATPKLRPLREVSVAAWIYIRDEMDAARCVVKGKNDHESYEIEIDGDDTLIFQFRDANDIARTRYDVNGTVWADEWIHIAGTYDGSSTACYVNGQLEETKDVNNPYGLSQDTNGLAIGNRPKGDANDTPFEGTIDDVRVYDYGLSQAEVAWLATEGTGVFLLTSPVNLFSGEQPEMINLKDFAKLMKSWLDEQLWPPEPAP
ncbi:MAG: LamG domain-containing protein [Planctomycetota bacterium]